MKGKKLLIFSVLVVVMSLALVGCGGGGSSADNEGSLIQSIASESDSSTADATSGTATEAATTAVTVEQMASAQVAEQADTSLEANDLVGSWENVNDTTRFANIIKDGENYSYEDNDGKYASTFKDGVLKVEVADGDYADVYIDLVTGRLVLVYQDNIEEFVKK